MLYVQHRNISDDEIIFDNYELIVTDIPVLDIKHGTNTSGNMIVDDYFDTHSHWGHKNEILSLIDDNYNEFVSRKPELGYGLCLV